MGHRYGGLRSIIFLLALFFTRPGWALEAFTVSDIEVIGAERISVGTVLNYLPIRAGEVLQPEDTDELIRALYATGLFEDVQLLRRDDVLIVSVRERPAISEIEITGNNLLGDEDLEKALEEMGIARGRVFNPSLLDELEQELRRLYFSKGYYALRVTSKVSELDRNRVAIKIDISEGKNAQIRKISILGNETFSDAELLGLMESGIPGPFAFWSSADEYSRAKLAGDLERLQSFYQDRGYIRFEIASTQVSITEDKSEIFVTININEGEPYRVTEVNLAGKLPLPEAELRALLETESGQIFSRQLMSDDRKAIASRLENEGYAFANINVVPDIDDAQQQVKLTFYIDPGQRTYVRRITFSGYDKTQDYVFRRELRQFEGGWYSPEKIDRSRIRLQRLRFVESVQVDTQRVPGSEDQIDIHFKITERPSGSFNIGVGYSSSQGVLVNLGLTHENVFGTGNRLSATLNNSSARKELSFSFTDPYFTEDGVSRTYQIFARETDAGELSSRSSYLSDAYGGGLTFGIPLSEFTTLRLGGSAEHTKIMTTNNTPTYIDDFLTEHGDQYNVVNLSASLNYDTRNRTVFAERGQKHTVTWDYSIPSSDLDYYKFGYDYEFFYPLHEEWLVASFRADIAYGDGYGDFDELPFFEKYFTGGVRSLRGYQPFSLGPKDNFGDAMGGDMKTVYTLELIFPPPWQDKPGSTRFSVFYDAGNVFADFADYDGGELRNSIGIAFNWLSPIGPLVFSWAEALNPKEGDETEKFQFSIGTLF